jgi:hypothetical protein
MTQEHSWLPPSVVIKSIVCIQWLAYYKGLRFQFGEQRIFYLRTCLFQINPNWHKLKAYLFWRVVEISYVPVFMLFSFRRVLLLSRVSVTNGGVRIGNWIYVY